MSERIIFEALARGEGVESVLPEILAEQGARAAVLYYIGEEEAPCAFREASLGLLEEMKGRLIDALPRGGRKGDPELALAEEDFLRLETAQTPAEIRLHTILFGEETLGGIALAWEAPGRQPPDGLLVALGIAHRIETARRADEEAQNRMEQLSLVGRIFAEGISLHRTLARLLQVAVDLVGASVGLLVLKSEEGEKSVAPIGWGVPPDWGKSLRLRDGRDLVEAVLADGKPRLLPHLADLDPAALPDALASIAAVPLDYEGGTLGCLCLANPPARFFEDESQRRALATLASLAGGAVRNARLVEAEIRSERLREEVRLAARVQADLLPRHLPSTNRIEAAAVMLPARNVGGDFYDMIDLGSDRWGMMIADVSGKGLSAAMLMATARAYLRAFAHEGTSPGEVLTRMNAALGLDLADDRFLTAAYLILDLAKGEIRMAGAGHHPILLSPPGGGVREIQGDGLPLGILPEGDFTEIRLPVEPGSSLIFFTDGLVEAESPDGRLYGTERVHATLAAASRQGDPSPGQIIDLLLSSVREWTRGKPLADDLTLLVVRLRIG